MRTAKVLVGLLLFLCLPGTAGAQFVGLGGGRLLSQNLADDATAGAFGTPRAESETGGIFALDVGFRRFKNIVLGVHYSSSGADLRIERGDAFGSRADVELKAHTFTFDTRVRTPSAFSFRLYGLAGAGLTRFGLDVKQEVENPFPGGAPDHITSFVLTYGGGVERHLHQLVHLRLEVRDYLTPASEQLFAPGGSWHRLAVIGGITIGL